MKKSKKVLNIVLPWLSFLLLVSNTISREYNHSIKVFHFMIGHWGDSRVGLQECGNIACDWTYSDHMKHLRDNLYMTDKTFQGLETITLSLYNIHSWWERTRDTKPAFCELHTNLTMAETEESKIRYFQLFDQSFLNFDGYSSTSPAADVQRVYFEAFLNRSDFLPAKNFSSMIKGASYVASDCHRRDSANANRDGVVQQIRDAGFRVDGLGRCMHSEGPEGISLPKSRDTRYNLYLKRHTIGHFLFNFAFENSLEPGYVTEKPFDALLAGTVPVYLGDAAQLKALLPDPRAAIFVSDFKNNYTALAEYLQFLSRNEQAYELHRSWRNTFSYEQNIKDKPLLQNSWWCRICEWAVENAFKPHKRTKICLNADANPSRPVKAPAEWEGKAIRGNSRQVYIVKGGALHGIPDLDTFYALGLKLDQIMVVEDFELEKIYVAEPIPPMNH